jgi:hypothetical protein
MDCQVKNLSDHESLGSPLAVGFLLGDGSFTGSKKSHSIHILLHHVFKTIGHI